MTFINFIAAAGGGGGPPPSGTTSELIPSTGTRISYGTAVDVSRDRTTIAVGDASANTIWIFTDPDEDGSWAEESRIAPGGVSFFGSRIKLSPNGNILAAYAVAAGAFTVRIYTRSAGTYSLAQTIAMPADVDDNWIVDGMDFDATGARLVVGSRDAYLFGAGSPVGVLHIYQGAPGTYAVEHSYSVFGTGWSVTMTDAGDRVATINAFIGYTDVLVRSGASWAVEYTVNMDANGTVRLDRDTGSLLVTAGRFMNDASYPSHYATRSGSTWTFGANITSDGYQGPGPVHYTTNMDNGASLSDDGATWVLGNPEGGSSLPAASGRVLPFASFTEGTPVPNPGSTAALNRWGDCVALAGDALFFAATAPNESAGRAWVIYL